MSFEEDEDADYELSGGPSDLVRPSSLKDKVTEEAKEVAAATKKKLTPTQLASLAKARAAKLAKLQHKKITDIAVTPESAALSDADIDVVDQQVKNHLKNLKKKYNVAVFDTIQRQKKVASKRLDLTGAIRSTVNSSFEEQQKNLDKLIRERLAEILGQPLTEWSTIAPTTSELKALVKATASDLDITQKEVKAVVNELSAAASAGAPDSAAPPDNKRKRDSEDVDGSSSKPSSNVDGSSPQIKRSSPQAEGDASAGIDSFSTFTNYF